MSKTATPTDTPTPDRSKRDPLVAASLRVICAMHNPQQTDLYERQQRLDGIVARIKRWREQ